VPAQPPLRHSPRNDIGGGDVAVCRGRREVGPDRAVPRRRHHLPRQDHALDPGRVGAHGESLAPRRHAQELGREAEAQRVLDQHDERHPAVDSVRVGPGREHAVAHRGVLDHGEVLKQPGILLQERLRVLAQKRVGHLAHRRRRRRIPREPHARLPRDDTAPRDGFGEDRVVVRKPGEIPAQRLRHVLALGQTRGRQPVGLGEDHVEGYGRRPVGHDPVDHRGQAITRPGPLSQLLDARVVQIDDGNGLARHLAWLGLLIKVEGGETKRRHRPRIGHAQHQQRRDQQQAQHPRRSEPPCRSHQQTFPTSRRHSTCACSLCKQRHRPGPGQRSIETVSSLKRRRAENGKRCCSEDANWFRIV
jgi:hypothetical protein